MWTAVKGIYGISWGFPCQLHGSCVTGRAWQGIAALGLQGLVTGSAAGPAGSCCTKRAWQQPLTASPLTCSVGTLPVTLPVPPVLHTQGSGAVGCWQDLVMGRPDPACPANTKSAGKEAPKPCWTAPWCPGKDKTKV